MEFQGANYEQKYPLSGPTYPDSLMLQGAGARTSGLIAASGGDLTGRPAEDAETPAPQLRESRLPDSFQTSQPAVEKDNEQFLSEDEPSTGRKGDC